jgi:hypothetical protein
MAIGDTSYEYELIWSELLTNRVVSRRASDSALSYSHRVRNGLMIAAKDRTLNLTTLNWSQIYSILQLNCSAIYWMKSIPCHSGHLNHKSDSPQIKQVWSIQWLIHISPFGREGSDISIIDYWLILYITVHISRCHNGLIFTTPHLPRTESLEHERIVICSASRNKILCR